ncbi:MAG: PilT/PilU family type 4a pilus ATPase [Burkholderiales bacterium]|nr:PilT/PilU family type 4a pilus ATPase [Burkholderiales bacterium]
MDLNPLFKLMAAKHASDLFFTAGSPILIKILGETVPVNAQVLDAATVNNIAYEMMPEAQVKLFEATCESNFSYPVKDVGGFRVNVFRQRGAVAMVVRYLKNEIPSLEELKLPPLLKELVMEKRGLVLVVGSTGSGKSTTLAAMIEYRSQRRGGHILTIEDPIEFVFKHRKSIVNQREVGIDTLTFDSALTNAMREAPDVLMIGEIRDRATLHSALIYAQTGHLCLSTLHANNSYHALNRIIGFFPYEARASLLMDLSISLRCVISQRLVPTKSGKITAAVEVLLNTKHIAERIKNDELDQIKEAMEKSMSAGTQTFEQALYKLYKDGELNLDDALSYSDSPSNLSWLIDNAGGEHATATRREEKPQDRLDVGRFNFKADVS